MTVASTNNRNDYTGTGSNDTYQYTFRIFAEANLLVTRTDLLGVESTLVLNVDYEVKGVGEVSGGYVALLLGVLPAGEKLSIRRVMSMKQQTDFRNQDRFYAEVHEDAFDVSRMIDQQMQDQLDRSPHLRESDFGAANTELPTPVASRVIGWNATATGIKNYSPDELVGLVGGAGSWSMQDFYAPGDFTPGTTTQLTLTADPGPLAGTLVTLDGVVMHKDAYSLSGAVITFAVAIPLGTIKVEVVWSSIADIGVPSDGSVTTPKLAERSVVQNKINLRIKDQNLTAPPGAPSVGDSYIVAAGGSGAWAGQDGNIVRWNGSSWASTTPIEGDSAWLDDENQMYTYDGSVWFKTLPFDSYIDRDWYATDAAAGTALKAILEDANINSVFVKAGTYAIATDVTQTPNQSVHMERSAIIQLPTAGTCLYIGNACKWYNGQVDGATTGGDATDGLVNVDKTQNRVLIGMLVHNSAANGIVGTIAGILPMSTQQYGGLYGVKSYDNVGDGFKKVAQLFGCAAISNGSHGYELCLSINGCISATNIGDGFRSCQLMSNCSSDWEGSAGFRLCYQLANCYASSSGSDAFNTCRRVVGCNADSNTAGNGFYACTELSGCISIDSFIDGFDSCTRMDGCIAGNSTAHGFDLCTTMSACEAYQASQYGFKACERVAGCFANDCGQLGGSLYDGFNSCLYLSACDSDSSDRHGYYLCNGVAGCRSSNNSSDGFNTCNRLSACSANSNADDGYDTCEEVVGCVANADTDNGFDACLNISGCLSTNHGGAGDIGYNGCSRISASHSVGDTAAGAGNSSVDNAANMFSVSAF